MQTRRSLTVMITVGTAAIVAPPLLSAQIGVQRERNVPNAYAITNARIVPVSGPAIEKGTIVVRNGVIAAVGATRTGAGRRSRHRRRRTHGLSRSHRCQFQHRVSSPSRERCGRGRARSRGTRRWSGAAGRPNGRAELAAASRPAAGACRSRLGEAGARGVRWPAERRHHGGAHRAQLRNLSRTLSGHQSRRLHVAGDDREGADRRTHRLHAVARRRVSQFAARRVLGAATAAARRAALRRRTGCVREEPARHAPPGNGSVARGAAAGARASRFPS